METSNGGDVRDATLASTSAVVVELDEDDIPGASLSDPLDKHTIPELKWWLLCQWTFNLTRAPWWGGVYEHMVQSTKCCLCKMLGRASLSYEELLTVIVEIEGVINSRPISYISAADREEPLTPSHLIVGRRLLSLPDHLSYVHDTQDEDFEVNAR